MTFKTIKELKAEIQLEASNKTLDELRKDVAQTIKDNVMFGEHEIEYFAPIGTNIDFLNSICSELAQLGYKAQIRTGESENKFILLTVQY